MPEHILADFFATAVLACRGFNSYSFNRRVGDTQAVSCNDILASVPRARDACGNVRLSFGPVVHSTQAWHPP